MQVSATPELIVGQNLLTETNKSLVLTLVAQGCFFPPGDLLSARAPVPALLGPTDGERFLACEYEAFTWRPGFSTWDSASLSLLTCALSFLEKTVPSNSRFCPSSLTSDTAPHLPLGMQSV